MDAGTTADCGACAAQPTIARKTKVTPWPTCVFDDGMLLAAILIHDRIDASVGKRVMRVVERSGLAQRPHRLLHEAKRRSGQATADADAFDAKPLQIWNAHGTCRAGARAQDIQRAVDLAHESCDPVPVHRSRNKHTACASFTV